MGTGLGNGTVWLNQSLSPQSQPEGVWNVFQKYVLPIMVSAIMFFTAGCSVTAPFQLQGSEYLLCAPEIYPLVRITQCKRVFSEGSLEYACQTDATITNSGQGSASNVSAWVLYQDRSGTVTGTNQATLGDLPAGRQVTFHTDFTSKQKPDMYALSVACDGYVPPEAATEAPLAPPEPPIEQPAPPEPPAIALDPREPGVYPWYPLLIPRTMHTATLLANGRILMAGGSLEPDDFVADEELVEPSTGRSTWAAPLHSKRHGHSATLLKDGRVLVVGGYNLPQQWLADAEIYDPISDSWTVVPPLFSHGVNHTATLMQDGRVLVVGGCIGSGVCTEKAEIFSPVDNSWQEAPPLATDRASQTAQLLDDGRVLVAGGSGANSGVPEYRDAVLFDPASNSWKATQPMVAPRHLPQSVRLLDGRVLVAGGIVLGDASNNQMTTVTEIYDPDTNQWTRAADLNYTRYSFNLILLKDGRVLAINGANRWDNNWDENTFVRDIELYDPKADEWTVIGSLPQPTANATGVLLPNGNVWVAGGNYGTGGDIFPAETGLIVPPKP